MARVLCSTFLGADRIRYGMMIEEIENEYLHDRDEWSKAGSYPLMITNANISRITRKIPRIYSFYWVKPALGRLEWHSHKQ
jgi:hypothetical protein